MKNLANRSKLDFWLTIKFYENAWYDRHKADDYMVK